MTTAPETSEETVLEETTAAIPYLRITAKYAASFDTGHPEEVTIDLNPDDGDEPDLTDDGPSSLIRLVTETVSVLRAAQKPLVEQIVFSANSISAETLLRIQDRLDQLKQMRVDDETRADRERRYGSRGLPPEVIDKVLVRDEPAYATGGLVSEPGTGGSDAVPATLGGCCPGDLVTGTADLPATSKAGE